MELDVIRVWARVPEQDRSYCALDRIVGGRGGELNAELTSVFITTPFVAVTPSATAAGSSKPEHASVSMPVVPSEYATRKTATPPVASFRLPMLSVVSQAPQACTDSGWLFSQCTSSVTTKVPLVMVPGRHARGLNDGKLDGGVTEQTCQLPPPETPADDL
jgi:hypothetical protein